MPRPLSLVLALAVVCLGATGARAAAPLAAPDAAASRVAVARPGMPPVTELVLANGLRVLLVENHASPVASWVVSYKVGSRNEGVGITGSAHLLEHMMFKGTQTLGKGQVAQILDRNGADSNASTWTDWTRYFETYSADRLELGLMIESARMRDALILDSERQSEMTVVRNELERGESNPSTLLYQALYATAFKAHPYHHPTIGWRSDVEGVATSELKRFYDTYYQPNNAVAVLVGDFKTADAVALVHKYFDAIPQGPTPPAMYTTEEPQSGERRVVLRRRGETNLVQMGYHIPAVTHADMGPLLVLDAVLSNGITSRMYQSLVEKQVATSAWSDAGLARDPSLFRVGATLKPGDSHLVVEQALQAQLDALKGAPVTPAELQKAKAQAEADYIYQNEGTQGLAFALASYGSIADWQRGFTLLDDIKAVTASDLTRVASTYLTPDNRTTAWYVATADGPLPPRAVNAGNGLAADNGKKPEVHAPFAFEKQDVPAHHTTPPKRLVLKNGMTVIVLANATSQTVALDGYVKAGSAEDPAGKRGVASAVASLLEEGTARRTKLQLAEDLESVSATLGFSPSTLSTSVTGRWIAKDTERVLTALGEELMTPTFPQAELDKLETRWVAGLRQSEDQPSTRSTRAWSHLLYPVGHPFYVDDLSAALASVQAIKRQDLVDFHRKYFGPDHTTLVLVGKVDEATVVPLLERAFAGWARAPQATLERIPDPLVGPGRRQIVLMADKSNVDIRYGHASALHRDSPNYYAATLANYVLGGSTLTGRLGLVLRDQMGLTYGVSSGFAAAKGGGSWRAGITVNPASVGVALENLEATVKRTLHDGLTPGELEFAKGAFIGSQAVSLATNAGMASSLANGEFYHLGLDYWSRYPQLIRGVTLAEANAALRTLVHPDKANVVIVGPYVEAEQPAKPAPRGVKPRGSRARP